MVEITEEGGHYLNRDDIDWSRMHSVFKSLPLFDDVFLNMQAMNVALVDQFITDLELNLLREYVEIEKTPLDSAIFVSAQTQMWIFALYELLRTWKQRVGKLTLWSENGGLETAIENIAKKKSDSANIIRTAHIRWVQQDESAINNMTKATESISGFYELLTEIRVSLAKHEIAGKNNSIASSPGYGYINMQCGSLDYDVSSNPEYTHFVNRRDLADAFRRIEIPL